MRLGLPFMLLASLAVHLGAGLIAFVHYSDFSSWKLSAPTPAAPELLLIAPQRVLTSQPFSSVRPATSSSLTTDGFPVLPPKSLHPALTPAGSPDLAFENHARPELREPAWETVMSPPMATSLDPKAATVFVLDVSGSMYEPFEGTTRLALARQTLSRYLRALPNGTPFAVTVYAETARNSGPLVAASDATRDAAVRLVMHDFDCGGGTDLPGGLVSAEQLRPGHLVIVTDGDLNATPSSLLADVAKVLGQGNRPTVNVVGIHPRSAAGDDSLLRRLALQQGGTYLADPGEKTLLTSAKTAITAR